MRQKSTVYSPNFHEQYKESEEEIMKEKMKAEAAKPKQAKQGLSSFRKKKSTQNQGQ